MNSDYMSDTRCRYRSFQATNRGRRWWAHQDSNLEPTDYESAALTVEL
jgi:hypothetical protein